MTKARTPDSGNQDQVKQTTQWCPRCALYAMSMLRSLLRGGQMPVVNEQSKSVGITKLSRYVEYRKCWTKVQYPNVRRSVSHHKLLTNKSIIWIRNIRVTISTQVVAVRSGAVDAFARDNVYCASFSNLWRWNLHVLGRNKAVSSVAVGNLQRRLMSTKKQRYCMYWKSCW